MCMCVCVIKQVYLQNFIKIKELRGQADRPIDMHKDVYNSIPHTGENIRTA